MAKSVTLVAATGTLTAAADPANTDAVTIGGITYTWVTTPAQANDIDVGASRQGSLDNLVAAINGTGVASATTYYAGTVRNPCVNAVRVSDTIVVTARVAGTLGNGIATTESEVDITWGAVCLTGGTGDTLTAINDLQDLNEINSEVFNLVGHILGEIA